MHVKVSPSPALITSVLMMKLQMGKTGVADIREGNQGTTLDYS